MIDYGDEIKPSNQIKSNFGKPWKGNATQRRILCDSIFNAVDILFLPKRIWLGLNREEIGLAQNQVLLGHLEQKKDTNRLGLLELEWVRFGLVCLGKVRFA